MYWVVFAIIFRTKRFKGITIFVFVIVLPFALKLSLYGHLFSRQCIEGIGTNIIMKITSYKLK